MDNFQSGKTQAIDLEELNVQTANRPLDPRMNDSVDLGKWGDDPWTSTEESRQRRRWADDNKWSGQNSNAPVSKKEIWDVPADSGNSGWNAPKRGDVLETSEGWDDWSAAPKEMSLELETKDNGGYRRVQAASQYVQGNDSDYASGRARRDDIYHQKEVYGTASIPERSGDPYANIPPSSPMPIPEMKPISEWNDEPFASSAPVTETTNRIVESEVVPPGTAPQVQAPIPPAPVSMSPEPANDDIPGVTRASLIIFQPNASPKIFEIKKISTSIGRALDNMVVLNDKYASRHQLVINYVNSRYEVFGLSQDNVAAVNGYPFSHVRLMNNDLIEVGATRIRFVFGLIRDEMLANTSTINGKPEHIDPPPQEVRSPKTTRKNLILLISGVAVIVFVLIIVVVMMAASKSTNVDSPTVAEDSEQQADDKADSSKKDLPKVELTDTDKSIVSGMSEAMGVAINQNKPGKENLLGHVIHIQINSEPSGAQIINPDGSVRGTTPYDAKERVNDEAKETWTIRLENYEDQTIDVSFAGNIEKSLTLTQAEATAETKEPEPAKKKNTHVHVHKRKDKKKPNKPSRKVF